MSTHRTLRTLAAALAATVGLLAASAPASTAMQPHEKPPKASAYEYRGTFTVELTHHVELEYYHEGDGKFIDASASLSGRIPSLVTTRVGRGVMVTMDTLGATVKALSGSVDSTTITDEGRTEVRCQGDSIWKTNKQHPFLLTDARGKVNFRAFALLSLPQTCRDNQGGEPTTSVHSFPELPARLGSKDKYGDKHLRFPLSAELVYPRGSGQTKDCPNSADSLTVACTYRLTGEINLTRVRSY